MQAETPALGASGTAGRAPDGRVPVRSGPVWRPSWAGTSLVASGLALGLVGLVDLPAGAVLLVALALGLLGLSALTGPWIVPRAAGPTSEPDLRLLAELTRTLSVPDEADVVQALLTGAARIAGPLAGSTGESTAVPPCLVLRVPGEPGCGVEHRVDGSVSSCRDLDQRGDATEPGATPSATSGPLHWVEAGLDTREGSLGTLRLPVAFPLPQSRRHLLSLFARSGAAALLNVRMAATAAEQTRELTLLADRVAEQAARSVYEASHDPLTGLANRGLLLDAARDLLARVGSDGSGGCALLLLCLDHSKEVGDTLGHDAEDQLMRVIARRLSDVVRHGDLVARLSGGEFAVLLQNISVPSHADVVGQKILSRLDEPLVLGGISLAVEASVGVACYPQDADDIGELLRRAAVAVEQAKQAASSMQRYDGARDTLSPTRLKIVSELQAALARDELVLHYQPKYDLSTRRVVGAEALVRWQHPDGMRSPVEFVPVVEQSGLIVPFTLHLLDLAVAECRRWQGEHDDDSPDLPSVAVNLSARCLLNKSLPAAVSALLRRHGLPADRLILEITETTVMSELDVVEEVLAALRELGVTLSVDDFGTGYSSLTFLQRIAVHEVKIDRSFISTLLTSPSDATIVRGTIDLAHGLGLRVVAEGVETIEQLTALRRLGCDLAQGYLLGRPIPADKVRPMMRPRAREGLAEVIPMPPRRLTVGS